MQERKISNFKRRLLTVKPGTLKINTYVCMIVFVTILLVLFAGTRYETGTDINTYQNSYNKAHVGNVTISEIESSFILMAIMLPSFEIFMLVIAAISIGLKNRMLYRFSPYFFVSLMLYYCQIFLQYDMGIMRQGLALALVICSWSFVDYDKLDKRYWFVLLLAVLAHYSSIVSVLPILLRKVKIPMGIMIWTSIAAVIISMTDLVQFVLDKIFSLIPEGAVFSKYAGFASESNYLLDFSAGNIRRVCFLLLFCYFLKRYSCTDKKINFYLNSYYLGTIFYYLFKAFIIISGRLSMYFCVVDIFLIPLSLSKLKGKKMKLLWVLVIALYCLYYVNSSIHSYIVSWMNEPYLPYQTWLFN